MPVYYSQFNSSLGNKLNNIREELNMEPTNTIEENTMETITNTEVKNFTTEQLEEFIVKEQQEITIMLNEVQEVESQTVEVNSQIDVLKEEHRQELIKQADALIIRKEEANVKLSAAKAVLADRKSVLRELKDSTYWPNGYTNSTAPTIEEEESATVSEDEKETIEVDVIVEANSIYMIADYEFKVPNEGEAFDWRTINKIIKCLRMSLTFVLISA